MTELDRYKRALNVALEALRSAYDTARNQVIAVSLAEINAILSPPPEYEEVEVTKGWLNVYPVSGEFFTTKEDADHPHNTSGRIDCQEIKVKVKRPKPRMVERSVGGKVASRSLMPGDMVLLEVRSDEFPPAGTAITVIWEEPAP